jgi:hypothetical protein
MTTKTRRNAVTLKARTAQEIAGDIVQGLQDIESAKESAGEVYKEAAAALDGIAARFTLIKWNKCKSPDSTKAAFTAAGVSDSQGVKIQEFRAVILDAVKAFNDGAAKTVWQSICRWSIGYTGSKPLHPDAKPAPAPKAEKTPKAEPMTATTRDAVLANPQNARKVISELIAGLTDNMGLKKKNKIGTTAIQEAIDALGQADIALAALK